MRTKALKMAEKGHPLKSTRIKLFLGNISYRVTTRDLTKFLSDFGPVEYCQIVKDHKKGWSRGIGFVTFKESSTAEAVLSLPPHQLTLDGREMRVSLAETPKRVKLRQTSSNPSEHTETSEEFDDSLEHKDHISQLSVDKIPSSEPVASHAPCETRVLNELSDDLWLIIFNYLSISDRSKIERVCKRWRALSLLSWKRIRSLSFENMFKSIFRGGMHQLTDGLLHTFLKRCGPGLASLDLSGAPHHLTDYALDLVGLCCGNLLHLNLSKVTVTKISLKTMAERIPNLKSISLQHCAGVSEKGLWWVLKLLKSLHTLNVAQDRKVTGQCFFQAPATLKEVYMSDCFMLSDEGVCILSRRCPDLEVIDISRCGRLTGRAISSLAEHCRKLKKLHFSAYGNKGIDVGHFMGLSRLSLLEELVVDRHGSITDDVIGEIGGYCPNLRYLSCEACYCISDESARYLAQCGHLEHIVLSYCDNFSDAGLLQLSSTHVALKKVILRACQAITNKGVGHLCSTCPDLLKLDISGCLSVTDQVLPVLREALCFLRQDHGKPLSIVLGGTLVTPEKAILFAEQSKTNISLFDLSTSQLASYYDPYLTLPCNEDEEDWEGDNFPSSKLDVEGEGLVQEQYDSKEAELEDYLIADDPAYHSDDFSGPEFD